MTLKYVSSKKVLCPKKQQSMKRYSYLIRLLRIAVPLSVTVVLVCVYKGYDHTFTPESSPSTQQTIENQLINPILLSKDAKGKPIVIKAQKATQKDNHALLENPHSMVELEENKKITITSNQATYQEKEKVLKYKKDVELKTSSGMMIKSDETTVNLKNNTASSEKPVSGQGPQGHLQAEGFTWNDDVLTLTGKSKMTFH